MTTQCATAAGESCSLSTATMGSIRPAWRAKTSQSTLLGFGASASCPVPFFSTEEINITATSLKIASHVKGLLPAHGKPGLTPWDLRQQVEEALKSPMFTGQNTKGVIDKPCSELFIGDIRRYLLGGLMPHDDSKPDPPKYQEGSLDLLVSIRSVRDSILSTLFSYHRRVIFSGNAGNASG